MTQTLVTLKNIREAFVAHLETLTEGTAEYAETEQKMIEAYRVQCARAEEVARHLQERVQNVRRDGDVARCEIKRTVYVVERISASKGRVIVHTPKPYAKIGESNEIKLTSRQADEFQLF